MQGQVAQAGVFGGADAVFAAGAAAVAQFQVGQLASAATRAGAGDKAGEAVAVDVGEAQRSDPEARREIYAAFLAAASDAGSRLTQEALDRQRMAQGLANQPYSDQLTGQFGPEAPMRMARQKAIVQILAGSTAVRQASTDLTQAVLAYASLDPTPDPNEWNQAFMAALTAHTKAHERFVDVANAELTSFPPRTSPKVA